MAEETLQLVPFDTLRETNVSYVVDFNGQQRQAAGIRHRLGQNAFSGPVALKMAVDGEDGEGAESRLRRELEVARYLGPRGGELLSKCLGYNFSDAPASTVVTYRGRPLADLVRDEAHWPLDHALRTKIITDLMQGLELLRVSSIVHGGIGLDTLYWDGTTLQITDFGQAALCGKYPDGRAAHHGDDVYAAGLVIYHVYTGQPPPADPVDLRRQIDEVQDVELRDLLLHRDLVAGTDLDYVFAADHDQRPTSRVLLNRLDRRPHGIQWEQLVARDRAVREDFRRLRERQRRFRDVYLPCIARRPAPPRPRPPRPVRPPAGRPPTLGPPGVRRPRSARPGRGPSWPLAAVVAVGVAVAVLVLLVLL